ncbi:endonuclease [Myroides marinus]|uniref:Endonuclease n=1 Tax=Myroides marinus TaxID=703342 RepID=A0A164AIY5_9FLAO|nr:endonuclease [Myroides marinus]KZE83944.1 endonuclease [Myroides marinus]MDM1350678.1 endonuclease [Myroides marinus]MDM1357885.1 endonuclease [Myroides marinus]MDM1365993.1 endonuclease [Myroides marinus]MDM1370610.1 endonuclease [Myroides marinus]
MRMNLLLVTFASLLLSVSSCTKDPIITDPTPGKEKPTEPTKPIDPSKPEPGKPGDFSNMPKEQADYYKTVDFKKTGMALKEDLAKLTNDAHKRFLSYGDIWEASKATDVVSVGSNEVYLLYGHEGVTSGKTAYTRNKNNHGGNEGQWNREHTYAKSLGTPNLQETGPGSDAHHLRPADVKWNSERGNLPFIAGSGVSKAIAKGWYPGDEWKGDVARMMMYMYVRYGDRCIPKYDASGNKGIGSGVVIGTANKIDPKMVELLLEWNEQDPVSEFEKRRNEYHGNRSNKYAQGNRNPFIDNPYLATQIWGGTKPAENTWKK